MSHLVSNATLAQISNRYKLIDKLRVSPHSALVVKSGEKSKANVFESYIAGLYQSYLQGPVSNGSSNSKRTNGQALDHVGEWLMPLFEPVAKFILLSLQEEQHRLTALSGNQGEEPEVELAQAAGASAMLNQHCIGKLCTGMPVYEHEPAEGLLWKTRCTAKLQGGEEV
jgi:ribonuclease-3